MGFKIGNMDFSTANDQLEYMIRLRLLKKLNMNKCYRCGQSIDEWNEYSMDHKIAWRNQPNGKELLTDPDNLTVSHKQCNTPDSQRGLGKSGYIGVHFHNNDKALAKWAANIKIDGERIYFKYWKDPKQAALARDMGAMKHFKGKIILNFPNLREFYIEKLKNNDWSFIDDSWTTLD